MMTFSQKHAALRVVLAAFVLWTFAMTTATADDSVPLQLLDVDTAVELALANNLGLRSQRIDVLIAERNNDHRFNVLIPQLSAQGTLSRPNAEPTDPLAGFLPPGSEPETPPRWRLNAAANAQLTLSTQMIHGVRSVADSYRNAEIELADAEREIVLEVRKAFYQLLLMQERLALAERRLDAAEQRLSEIQDNYEAGLVDELTLLQTEVSVANQRPAILRQRRAMETALQRLATTIGLPSVENIDLRGSIELDSRSLRETGALLAEVSENASVRAARRGIEGMLTRIDLTRAQLYPSLTISFSLSPTLSGDPWSADVWESDNWNDNGALSFTLRQPIDPLLPGSQTRQELANQRDRLKQAELQVQQALEGVELQVMQLAGSIEDTETTIDSLLSNVSLAERRFELASEAYEAGLRDYSAVRDAEIDLGDARLQLLQEQHSLIELTLDLAHLLNSSTAEITQQQENNE
ncbi:MAG: TolC family protein [Spirochaetaceae bacterium]|nr:MAG: TolC family protein [Spirochaetaceae bacterium]